jgi:putative redox protein
VALRTGRSHEKDCEACVQRASTLGPLRLERRVELHGALDDEQRERLLEIADRCPVKLALQRGVEVVAAAE